MEEFSTEMLSREDLVMGGVLDLVEENRASARRWARMVTLHHRHESEPREDVTPGWGAMTPRALTADDVSGPWAMGDQHTRTQLNVALFLAEHLPQVWAMCLSGALDRYRATTVADLLRNRLDDPGAWARAARGVTAFLRKHLRTYTEFNIQMVTCTVTQLRNRLNYEIRKLLTDDEDFQIAHRQRTVWTAPTPTDGISQLGITGTTDQVLLARHRLHLSAKEKRNGGDARTIEQLMADLALDLIIGNADDVPVPAYARPIINVTVPMTTLAGIADDPGQLSGGTVIPADLARAIAMSEGATWYRLLTDAQEDPVNLSTTSYQPTDAIWRYVVATQPTCSHEGCDRPATECELDHREEWPHGPTSAVNLDPLCRGHHKAKHHRDRYGERLELEWEYQDLS